MKSDQVMSGVKWSYVSTPVGPQVTISIVTLVWFSFVMKLDQAPCAKMLVGLLTPVHPFMLCHLNTFH